MDKIVKDMLNQGKTIIILIFILFQVISCNNNQDRVLREKSKQYIEFSKRFVGNDIYETLSRVIRDSTLSWAKNNILYWEGEIIDSTYQIDSLKCFNTQKDKVVTAILAKSTSLNAVMDGIHFFYGVKIRNTWYFFEGATIYLPREYYQKDIHTPLSFEKLHEIAMKEVFSGYLIKDEKGNWQINDKFFEYHFYNKGICSYCKTEEDFEEVWKYNALSQWKK